jgi:hypothetical protein
MNPLAKGDMTVRASVNIKFRRIAELIRITIGGTKHLKNHLARTKDLPAEFYFMQDESWLPGHRALEAENFFYRRPDQ